MKIRNVEPPDLQALAALSCMVNQLHVDAYPEIYKRISRKTATQLLAPKISNPKVLFRLAEEAGQAVGYCVAEIREVESELLKAHRCLYLAEIMVSPNTRRLGVGKALLADLKQQAAQHQIQRIDLDVSAFNDNAQHFFASQGFEPLRYRLSWMV